MRKQFSLGIFSLFAVLVAGDAAHSLSLSATPSGLAGASLYQVENKAATLGNWETGIWLPVSGPAANLKDQDDVTWASGVAKSFTLVLNAALDTLTFTIGGVSVTTAYAGGSHNALQFAGRTTVNANTPSSSFTLSDLVLDGTPLDDGFAGAGGGTTQAWLESALIADGYTLTGNARFDWTGTVPKNSNLAFHLYGTNVVPEPGTALLLGAGLAGLAFTGRKRSQ